MSQLAVQSYLEEVDLLPLLTKAFDRVAVEKPSEPLKFIAQYLLENNPEIHKLEDKVVIEKLD